MRIRAEHMNDLVQIRDVNRAAFGSSAEAGLVDALRTHARPFVSLVATDGDDIIGHIAFSPVTVSSSATAAIAGLAPVAVLPSYQRRGLGSALVHAGLERCAEVGFSAVVVLGHPTFYQRFGFAPASTFGLRSTYDVPVDVFMALELVDGALQGTSGVVHYDPAFADTL